MEIKSGSVLSAVIAVLRILLKIVGDVDKPTALWIYW